MLNSASVLSPTNNMSTLSPNTRAACPLARGLYRQLPAASLRPYAVLMSVKVLLRALRTASFELLLVFLSLWNCALVQNLETSEDYTMDVVIVLQLRQ